LYIDVVPQWTIVGARKIAAVRANEENVCWNARVRIDLLGSCTIGAIHSGVYSYPVR
jgi:hypothetical protein